MNNSEKQAHDTDNKFEKKPDNASKVIGSWRP